MPEALNDRLENPQAKMGAVRSEVIGGVLVQAAQSLISPRQKFRQRQNCTKKYQIRSVQ
jgi:hypothetical protein